MQLLKGSSVPDEGHLRAHNTNGVGSGIPISQERGHGGGCPLATAAPFIATPIAALGLPVLRTTASAHDARLISGDTMGAALASAVTTSFETPKTTSGLATATTAAIPTIPTAAMAVVGSEDLAPAPGTFEGEHLAQAPLTSERVHHAGHAGHRRDGKMSVANHERGKSKGAASFPLLSSFSVSATL